MRLAGIERLLAGGQAAGVAALGRLVDPLADVRDALPFGCSHAGQVERCRELELHHVARLGDLPVHVVDLARELRCRIWAAVWVGAAGEVAAIDVAGQRADARQLCALEPIGQAEQQRRDGAHDVAHPHFRPWQLAVAAVFEPLGLDREAQVVLAVPDQLAVAVQAGASVKAISVCNAVLHRVQFQLEQLNNSARGDFLQRGNRYGHGSNTCINVTSILLRSNSNSSRVQLEHVHL